MGQRHRNAPGEIREQGPFLLQVTVTFGTEMIGVSGRLFFHIVISVEEKESLSAVKPGEETEYIVMDFNDLTNVPVFPKLIPVPHLNIGVTCIVIVFQGGEI